MKCDKVLIIGALAPVKLVIAKIEALAEASGEGGHLNEDQQAQAASLVEDFAIEGGKASSQLAFVLIKDEGEAIAEKIEEGAKSVIEDVEGLVDSAINRVKSALGGDAPPAPDVTSTSTATVEANTPASPEIAAAASASPDSSAASTSAPEAAPASAPAVAVESQPQS